MNMKKRMTVAAIAASAMVVLPSRAADQYWVGGTSGLWSGANWADTAGGAGGAWTAGSVGRFTTSPSTIDLNGDSVSVLRFMTSGFSDANPCQINIVNTSGSASTFTYSGFNRNSDSDLGHAELSFENVAVNDTSTWGLELTNGSRLRFGSGSSYTKPSANSSGDLFVGLFSATSNTLTVTEGSTVNVNNHLYIGCSKNADNNVACTGVIHVVDGTLNVPGGLYMARSTAGNNVKNSGTGVLVVDDGGTVNVKGNIEIGSKWQNNHTHDSKADIIVNCGGVLNCAKFIAWEYANRGRKVCIDGGTFNCNGPFEAGHDSAGLYKSRNYTVEVKNGGVLALGGDFNPNSYNGAKETVTFDGGTFRALGNISTISSSSGNGDYTDFKIGAGGMTIDTQGYTMTWTTRIDESEGKVTKKGSGKLNLNWTTYNDGGIDTRLWNGPLTIKGGATLEKQTGNNPSYLASSVTFKDGAKLNVPYSGGAIGAVVASAITVEGTLAVSFSAVPAEGAYPLLTITGEGTFDEGVLSRINKPEGDAYAGALFALSADEKSVMLILSSDPVWIGGTSGDLGDPTKWSTGVVPGPNANAIITAGAAATLTNSAAFKATSITFPAGCPKMTIEGSPLTGIEAINNLSSANHEFKAAVDADALVISNTTTYCVFTGGLAANSVSFGVADNTKAAIYGTWHIKGDWHPVEGNSLYNGASVTVDGALLNPNNLSINSGCVVTAATMKVTTSNYTAYKNEGRIVITGTMDVQNTTSDFKLANNATENATVIAGGIVFNTTRWPWLSAKTLVVGKDGINFGSTQDNTLRFSNSSSGVTLYSRDETTALEAGYEGKTQLFVINNGNIFTVCTTRFESEEAATVYVNGKISSKNGNDTWTGGMAVTGSGTLVFNSESTFTGGLTVTNTATVAVNAGKTPGSGAVTVHDGATLKVAESGTVTLGGGLTLEKGAVLAFNFTERASAPKLAIPTLTLGTGAEEVNVKISADDDERPKYGAHVIATGSNATGVFSGKTINVVDKPDWVESVVVDANGDLVCNVKPVGLIIIFQ